MARDPGLQPERTLLAWRRTALALVAASAVATRWLAVELGPFAGVLSAVGVLAAVFALVAAQRRYRRVTAGFAAADARRAPLPAAGAALALVAASAVLVGFAGAALVVVLALGAR
ncbi:DUF202 domain-containing protein [Protaetiibacter larvae]|uniref:DUF202 domain-containing protein n=1 Tax=Protaetiibacter larvae TaxID=2592654 RepID=UPI001FE43702|nr:DUF202 domain-containing protein [Protaetiibacter larvae]